MIMRLAPCVRTTGRASTQRSTVGSFPNIQACCRSHPSHGVTIVMVMAVMLRPLAQALALVTRPGGAFIGDRNQKSNATRAPLPPPAVLLGGNSMDTMYVMYMCMRRVRM